MILRETLPLAVAQWAFSSSEGPTVHIPAELRSVRIRRELPSAEGERAWLLELEVEVPAIDPERLLAECEEFLVDGRDGRRIGIVEGVEKSVATGEASTLLVSAGWFGRRRLRVDAQAIEALVPAERRLIVDESRVAPACMDRSRA
jgi:hypothetical protein